MNHHLCPIGEYRAVQGWGAHRVSNWKGPQVHSCRSHASSDAVRPRQDSRVVALLVPHWKSYRWHPQAMSDSRLNAAESAAWKDLSSQSHRLRCHSSYANARTRPCHRWPHRCSLAALLGSARKLATLPSIVNIEETTQEGDTHACAH